MNKSCTKIKEIKNIRTLINDIKSGKVGWYGYQGKTILVGYRKGRDENGRDSKQRTYWDRRKKGLCVKAEDFYSREISIPLYPAMSQAQIKYVVNVLIEVFNKYAR